MENMSREEYLQFRQNEDQASILAAYFSDMTEQNVEVNNFVQLMFQAIEDDPNLQIRIDESYYKILKCYDKKFNINFLYKEYGEVVELIKMY